MRSLAIIIFLFASLSYAEEKCSSHIPSEEEMAQSMETLRLSLLQPAKSTLKTSLVELQITKLNCVLQKTDQNLKDKRRLLALDYHAILTDLLSIDCPRQKRQIEFNRKNTGTSSVEIQAQNLPLAHKMSEAFCR